jgi:hypothetical protein
MDESLAAPLSGLPSLLTALASQLPGAGAAFAAGAAGVAGAAFAAGAAGVAGAAFAGGVAGAAGAVACAKARDAVKRAAPNTATICFIMISLLNLVGGLIPIPSD